MKKVLAIALAMMLLAVSVVGCSSGGEEPAPAPNGQEPDVQEPVQEPDGGAKIALITDKGNIDDKSFNQGSWEGVVEFAEREGISHNYIKPEEATDDFYLAAIDLAVEGGAEVVVTPGFLFEVAVYQAQDQYPDVKFILLDGAPRNADYSDFKTNDNVASILYAEEESGYLAGYAAVMDGMAELGFMGGMAVPAVQAFGYGYLEGAEDAAVELGLDDGAITSIYHYTGDFDENDTNKATASTMYQ
ncbi:MAG TPA: BMP family ABC transporter substrate-binding protein, partial [Tissierellaceae bacterium]|nr:BMP family ABC transporter substrate-binding protein [Tissierellaceae bacterium]